MDPTYGCGSASSLAPSRWKIYNVTAFGDSENIFLERKNIFRDIEKTVQPTPKHPPWASVGAACPNCSYHPDSRSDIRDNNTLTYILETISVDSTTRGLMEEEGVPVQVEDADDTSSIELQFIVGFRGGLKGLQDYSWLKTGWCRWRRARLWFQDVRLSCYFHSDWDIYGRHSCDN